MSQLTASVLHRAIDTCKLRVCAASSEFGRFPSILIMIGYRRVAQIGSQFHDAPTAVAQGRTVRIEGSPGVRAAIEIACNDLDEASMIARSLDNQFHTVFTEMYGSKNCLS